MDLGEHIVLSGFSENEAGELTIIKKLVGNHVKHLSEHLHGFEKIELVHKDIHGGSKHEIHGKLFWAGKEANCDVTDNNLFFAIDACLKKLSNQTHV